MTIPLQTLGGAMAGCVSLFAYVPYARDTVRGVARPNHATWLIWSVVSGLLFASYNAAAGGAARWVPLSDALGPAVIALLAIRYGKGGWGWLDVACLTLAGLSVIGWVVTGSPMVSLWINLLLLFLGAIPTFRNLYFHPASEPALAWRLFLLSDMLNLLAIEHWTWSSAAYPAYIALTAGVMNAFICRRLAAFSPLVGKCPSHRCDCSRRAHRINLVGLCAIPVRRTTSGLRLYHQSSPCYCRPRLAHHVP